MALNFNYILNNTMYSFYKIISCKIIFSFFILLSVTLQSFVIKNVMANQEEYVVNSIIAVVDNEPITLFDLQKRVGNNKLQVGEIAQSKIALAELDNLIKEKLLIAEAEKRRITAEASEIERYLIEVASKNNLELSQFINALKEQGKDIETFKKEVKAQILRSKIASFLIEEGVTVSEDDIDKFLEENPQFDEPGVKVQIKQIFLEISERRDAETAKRLLSKIKADLDMGQDFETQAVRFSESPEAKEGGDLGLLDFDDLNPLIQNSIKDLSEGQLSEISVSPAGAHLFKLLKKFDNSVDAIDSVRKEVREIINRQKLTEKIDNFFTKELYNLHAVEKKV